MTILVAALGASYLVSAVFVWQISRSLDPLPFKLLLVFLVLLPILGPLAYLWIRRWPDTNPDRARVGHSYRSYLNDQLAARDKRNALLRRRTEEEYTDSSETDIDLQAKRKDSLFRAGAIVVGVSLGQAWLFALILISQRPHLPTNWAVKVDAVALFAILVGVTVTYIVWIWRCWFRATDNPD